MRQDVEERIKELQQKYAVSREVAIGAIRAWHLNRLIELIGEDCSREGLLKTPERVSKMYDEVFGGYAIDPAKFLETVFTEGNVRDAEDIYEQGMVVVRDIQFYSHCEHHMVPFFGKAHVGYIPKEKVVGLSKICRVVDAYARRLQVQERLTKQVCDLLWDELKPQGAIVVMEAEHLCMKMRGIKNPCADTVTSCVRGAFTKPEVRQEFFSLLRSKQ